jgi:hypothetical protein
MLHESYCRPTAACASDAVHAPQVPPPAARRDNKHSPDSPTQYLPGMLTSIFFLYRVIRRDGSSMYAWWLVGPALSSKEDALRFR